MFLHAGTKKWFWFSAIFLVLGICNGVSQDLVNFSEGAKTDVPTSGKAELKPNQSDPRGSPSLITVAISDEEFLKQLKDPDSSDPNPFNPFSEFSDKDFFNLIKTENRDDKKVRLALVPKLNEKDRKILSTMKSDVFKDMLDLFWRYERDKL
jgi:hypothetical protein